MNTSASQYKPFRLLHSFLSISLFFLSLSVFSGEKISQSMQLEKVGHLTVKNARGKIKIVGWPKSEISVSGELDDETETFIFNENDGQSLIEIVLINKIRAGQGSQLTIHVPQHIAIAVIAKEASVSIEKALEYISIKTTSGNVSLINTGELDVQTISGKVRAEKLNGNIGIFTLSGDIQVEGISNSVKVKSVSGEVYINNKSRVRALDMETVGSGINYIGHFAEDAQVSAHSVSGNIMLETTPESAEKCVLNAGPKGNIINQLTQVNVKLNADSSKMLKLPEIKPSKKNCKIDSVAGEIQLIENRAGED